jgi:hypothetical protein
MPCAPRFARRSAQPLASSARGAAQQAKPVRAWLRACAPVLVHAGSVLRRCARHAPARTTKPEGGQPGAAPVAPRQPRAPSTASQPSTRAVCHPGERRAAYSHSSAGRPRRSRMAPRHAGRTPGRSLPGGRNAPPRPPAPAAAGNRRGTVRARPRPPRHRPPAPAQPWRKHARARTQAAGACAHGGAHLGARRRPAGAGILPHASAGQGRRQEAPGRPRVRSRAPKELAARFECQARAGTTKHRGAAPAPQGLRPSTPPGARPWTQPRARRSARPRTDAPRHPNGRRG